MRMKTYWEKFCNDEEKRLTRVRDSFSKLPYLPVIPNSRDSDTDFRNFVDSNAFFARGFDENVLVVESSKFFIVEEPVISLKATDGNHCSAAEPTVRILPPTPLKSLPKNDAATIVETNVEKQYADRSATKREALREESESLGAPAKSSIATRNRVSGDRRVYSKGTCPFHRYEPAIKIFDDDIEKYLTDDPRTSVPDPKSSELLSLPDVRRIETNDKSGKGNSVERIVSSREKSERRPNMSVIDLATACEAPSVEVRDKGNDTSKRYNFEAEALGTPSDSLMPDAQFSLDKKSRKGGGITKIATLLPRLLQPRGGEIKSTTRHSSE